MQVPITYNNEEPYNNKHGFCCKLVSVYKPFLLWNSLKQFRDLKTTSSAKLSFCYFLRPSSPPCKTQPLGHLIRVNSNSQFLSYLGVILIQSQHMGLSGSDISRIPLTGSFSYFSLISNAIFLFQHGTINYNQ